jgi:hypothetical protein
LDHGITATRLPVGEPCLGLSGAALEFAGLLADRPSIHWFILHLTSRWVLAYVLVGDPLYNPWKTDRLRSSALTMFPLAPIAPSDQAFADPLLARDDVKRLQSQSRIRLDAILQNQARTLGPAAQ